MNRSADLVDECSTRVFGWELELDTEAMELDVEMMELDEEVDADSIEGGITVVIFGGGVDLDWGCDRAWDWDCEKDGWEC